MLPIPELLTISEAADYFDVHVSTVRRWINEGRLTPKVTLPSGRVRFHREDVEKIIRGDAETPPGRRDPWTPPPGAGLDADPEVPSITPRHDYGREEVA